MKDDADFVVKEDESNSSEWTNEDASYKLMYEIQTTIPDYARFICVVITCRISVAYASKLIQFGQM